MVYFFGIFTDIFSALGIVLGSIVVVLLALMIVVLWIVGTIFGVGLALGLVYVMLYYWPRCAYFMMRGRDIPPDPVAAWFDRKQRAFFKWLEDMQLRMDEIGERLKEKAAAERQNY